MRNVLRCSSDSLAVGLLFVAIGLLASFSPAQSDTWWHLRSGHEIWSTFSISLHDTYSHTAAGSFWPNHEWLTDVVFFAVHRVGGMPLLTAACAAAIIGAWALSWRLATGPSDVRFVLFAFALTAATSHWAIRPQVFSLAMFATTVSMLAAGRYAWLPALFVIWTNLHGAVALGIVAVAAALLVAIMTERALPRSLTLAAAGCMLATLISPIGYRLWIEVPRSIERSRIFELVEWRPPGGSPGLWSFWAIAIAVPLMALCRRHLLDRRSWTLVAIAVAVLPLALHAIRNVPVFLLVAAPALSTLVSLGARPELVRPRPGEHDLVNGSLLALVVLAAAAVVATSWRAPAPALGWRPITTEAAAAVASCPDPLYNTYEAGGILIWFVPQTRVFIDSRQDPYPMELLGDSHTIESNGQYEPLFTRYGIRCAVVPDRSPIADRLRADPAWSLRYGDQQWAVFSRR